MSALLRLLACWSALAAAPALAAWLGREGSQLATFGLAAALAGGSRGAEPPRGSPLVLTLGVLAGLGTHGLFAGLTAVCGLGLGLASDAPAPARIGLAGALAVGLAAPLFEERLYRGTLLGALVRACGGPFPAILASSALFALPHPDPWARLGTFLVGLALGATRLVGRSVGLCVALHVGLNGAALARLAPDPRHAALAAAAWLGAVWLARTRPRPCVRSAPDVGPPPTLPIGGPRVGPV